MDFKSIPSFVKKKKCIKNSVSILESRSVQSCVTCIARCRVFVSSLFCTFCRFHRAALEIWFYYFYEGLGAHRMSGNRMFLVFFCDIVNCLRSSGPIGSVITGGPLCVSIQKGLYNLMYLYKKLYVQWVGFLFLSLIGLSWKPYQSLE